MLIDNEFVDDGLAPEERVFRALARAEDQISRLDERAKACGFTAGWRDRADMRATIARMGVEGELIHPEDLLLHALGMDSRMPERALLRASALLRARQKAWRGGEEVLSWRGVVWLTGRVGAPPPVAGRPSLAVGGPGVGGLAEITGFFERLAKGQADSPRAAVEDCLEVLDVTAGASPVMMAAALMEAWRVADPVPGQSGLGGLLAAQVLHTQRRFTAGLFPLEVSLRRRPRPPRLDWASLGARLGFWFECFERSAALELAELDRLATQKALLERKVAGGRRHSKAPALAALAVHRPVLTTEIIVRELGVTPQGCGLLLKRFGGLLQEVTGRSSYRVWRL